MQPLAIILNIAIVVGIVGIIVYWVRRFAVFQGYKAIQPDVLQIAALLKTDPYRDRSDVVLAGHYGGFPTIVRFSHRVDTPGLDIQMRLPATLSFSLMPHSHAAAAQGRVQVRTGRAALDRRFTVRTDYPTEFKMLIAGGITLGGMEQLCCSTQTGLTLADRTLQLSELTIPPFTANHVFDHLQSLLSVAKGVREMPGTDRIAVAPLPRRGSSWPVRVALAGGLVCLVGLLFTQPYSHIAGANANAVPPSAASGVMPADAARLQQLEGWRVVKSDDFSDSARRVLRDHNLAPSGHITADFSGWGRAVDSAYLLTDSSGRRRVSMLAKGLVAYDVIFPRIDFLARVPRSSLTKIQWIGQPTNFAADGDALLVVQDANDPASSLVLLRHGTQTYPARPKDFTMIDLVSE